MQKTPVRPHRPVLAVARAIDPEPLASIILDLEIFPHRRGSASCFHDLPNIRSGRVKAGGLLAQTPGRLASGKNRQYDIQ
jgi:hypothetical protein